MKNKSVQFAIALCLLGLNTIAQELYKAPSSQTKTVWVSPENPTGADLDREVHSEPMRIFP